MIFIFFLLTVHVFNLALKYPHPVRKHPVYFDLRVSQQLNYSLNIFYIYSMATMVFQLQNRPRGLIFPYPTVDPGTSHSSGRITVGTAGAGIRTKYGTPGCRERPACSPALPPTLIEFCVCGCLLPN